MNASRSLGWREEDESASGSVARRQLSRRRLLRTSCLSVCFLTARWNKSMIEMTIVADLMRERN